MLCLVVLVVVLATVCRAKGAVVLDLFGPGFAHASVLELVWCIGLRSRCNCLRSRLCVLRLSLRAINACRDLHLRFLYGVCALSPRSSPILGGGFPALPRGGGVARIGKCLVVRLDISLGM